MATYARMERAVDIVDDSGWDAGASIWLNRNGRGDIFKPKAKFGAWVYACGSGAGVSGVPRISLHYLTIRWQLYRF